MSVSTTVPSQTSPLTSRLYGPTSNPGDDQWTQHTNNDALLTTSVNFHITFYYFPLVRDSHMYCVTSPKPLIKKKLSLVFELLCTYYFLSENDLLCSIRYDKIYLYLSLLSVEEN